MKRWVLLLVFLLFFSLAHAGTVSEAVDTVKARAAAYEDGVLLLL